MASDQETLLTLIHEQALKFGDFTLASGQRSHFYIDCRKVTLASAGAVVIGRRMLAVTAEVPFDVVAGLTLGADPVISAVLTMAGVEGRALRGAIIRKEAKGHGTGQQIEGPIQAGDRVLVVEDVTTTGGSALKAIEALRAAGAVPVAVATVLDRQAGAEKLFHDQGLPFFRLVQLDQLDLTPPA